jgi:hypothetical protein
LAGAVVVAVAVEVDFLVVEVVLDVVVALKVVAAGAAMVRGTSARRRRANFIFMRWCDDSR